MKLFSVDVDGAVANGEPFVGHPDDSFDVIMPRQVRRVQHHDISALGIGEIVIDLRGDQLIAVRQRRIHRGAVHHGDIKDIGPQHEGDQKSHDDDL